MNVNFRIGSNKGEGALWVDVTLQVVAALQHRAGIYWVSAASANMC